MDDTNTPPENSDTPDRQETTSTSPDAPQAADESANPNMTEQAPDATTDAEDAPDADAPAQPDETPDATADRLQADVSLDETGPCTRRLTIEIPQPELQKQIDESYDELRKNVFIKGFRPGHVPRHVLQRRFGDDVLDSVKESVVNESLRNAIEDHDLDLAVAPDLELDDIELDPDQPLRYEITLEVAPEFTIDNYTALAVNRPPVTVSDEDIARALDSFRQRHGSFDTLDTGTLTEGDIPVGHAVVLQGDDEIWSAEEIGANPATDSLGGIPVEGLGDVLAGASVGDTITHELTLPDTFPVEAHRGQDATLEFTLDQIRRFSLPDATDQWAQSLDFEDLDDLREEIEDELHQARQREAEDAVRRQIDDRLLELTDFDIPDGLIDRMVEERKTRLRTQLLYQGIPEDQLDDLIEQRSGESRQAAIRDARLQFIYRQIAEQEKTFVTESDLDARIQAIALNYRRRPEEVRDELDERGQLDSLRHQMRDERVRDYLVEHAEITEAEDEEAPAPETGEDEAAAEAEAEEE
jgi:trigger factor